MGKPNFIYIGPNVLPIGLKKFTLYRSADPPPQLKTLIDAHPVLGALYVSTQDLSEAQREITHKGSLAHTANQKMLEIAKTIPR